MPVHPECWTCSCAVRGPVPDSFLVAHTFTLETVSDGQGQVWDLDVPVRIDAGWHTVQFDQGAREVLLDGHRHLAHATRSA